MEPDRRLFEISAANIFINLFRDCIKIKTNNVIVHGRPSIKVLKEKKSLNLKLQFIFHFPFNIAFRD